MIVYHEKAEAALDAATAFLKKNKRPHALIGQTPKGYIVIDPRFKDGHYCQIIGKLYKKLC